MDLPIMMLLEDDRNQLIEINNMVQRAFDLAQPINAGAFDEDEVTRNKNYSEIIIPRYNDMQFIQHFRMSRQTFEALVNSICPLYHGEDMRISLEKKLLMAIWVLSKQESFLAVSDRFDLGKSSCHRFFYEMIDLICQLMQIYIKWPENHGSTEAVFRQRSRGIPGIMGAIDGCHIEVKQPLGNAHDYFNRKQKHSIILQVD